MAVKKTSRPDAKSTAKAEIAKTVTASTKKRAKKRAKKKKAKVSRKLKVKGQYHKRNTKLELADIPDGARKPRGLNERQERFCQEFFVDYCPARAARRAGYSAKTADSNAYKMMTQPVIEVRIAELKLQRNAEITVTVQDVVAELARVGFFDLRRLYHEDGRMKKPGELDFDTARAVKRIKVEELFAGGGDHRIQVGETVQYELHDKMKALNDLGRHLKMFADVQVHEAGDSLTALLDSINGRTLGPPSEREPLPDPTVIEHEQSG